MFEAAYRPLRNRIYAHGLATRERAVPLFAQTRLAELRRIIRFLQRLGDGLWGLYWNGQNPIQRRYPSMDLAKVADAQLRTGNTSEQAIIVADVLKVMERVRRP
jgi:hypothetical protein